MSAEMPEFEAEQESRLWRWLFGVVVLAAVIWAAAELTGSDRPERVQDGAPAAVDAPAEADPRDALPAPLVTGAGFQAWVRDSAEFGERLEGYEYAVEGMSRLGSALQWITDRAGDTEAQRRAASIRATAGQLTPGAADHGAATRDLFIDAAQVVAATSSRAGAGTAADRNVQQALAEAASLDAGGSLEHQRHRVFSYFDYMAEAIAAIARATDRTTR